MIPPATIYLQKLQGSDLVSQAIEISFWIQLRLLRFSHLFSFLHGLFLASEYPTEYEEWLFGSEASVS